MRRALKILGFVMGLLAITGGWYWHYRLKPKLLAENAWWGSMNFLSEAVLTYRAKKGRLPLSLEEMVRAGVIPERSPLYADSMQHMKIIPPVVSYKECEFEVHLTSYSASFAVPEKVWSQPQFAHLGKSWTMQIELAARPADANMHAVCDERQCWWEPDSPPKAVTGRK